MKIYEVLEKQTHFAKIRSGQFREEQLPWKLHFCMQNKL